LHSSCILPPSLSLAPAMMVIHPSPRRCRKLSLHNGEFIHHFHGFAKNVVRGNALRETDLSNAWSAHPTYYIVLEHGIYTSSDPKPPMVKMGMCGTPLLRLGNKRNDSVVAYRDILGSA
jgi:hypothetical protein